MVCEGLKPLPSLWTTMGTSGSAVLVRNGNGIYGTDCGFCDLAAFAPTALVLSASTVYVEYIELRKKYAGIV